MLTNTDANGVVSTYTYNKANRITNIVNKNGNTTISSYEYSYYLDGSDACKVRNESGIIETTEYEYDGLKRLEEESVKVGNNTTDTYSYEYDDYGNRSKMTATGTEDYVTEYSYNNAQGKYTALLQSEVKTVDNEEKQTVYTYDANGNQIKKVADGKTETNTYDGLNQLIGFTDGETEASYKYNAGGLRYEKTVDGQTINHVWDGSKQIIADVIDNQFYEADCYIRGTSLVAKYNYKNGDKTEYTYYTQNAHGDVVNLTNENGEVTKKYTYDAFGVEKNIDENDANAFRYCGEYFDTETGTIYLRARYYNPTTGRFISRDSFAGNITDPLSLNLYTYCANNPIIYVDPSGHSYATLPSGNRMSINSASDAKLLSERRKQFAESSSQVVTTTAPQREVTPITGGTAKPTSYTTTYTMAVISKVKYDVPLYSQYTSSLCWACSQVMVESYQMGIKYEKSEAYKKVKQLAKSVNGEDDWNRGNIPTNIEAYVDVNDIDDINELYNILSDEGPVYATYYNDNSGHMVVVTGVDVNNDIVYTNNPWDIDGEQSYEEFLNGYTHRWYDSYDDMKLKTLYIPIH